MEDESEAAADPMLRKKEIVEHVAAATGLKKRDIRTILDAAMLRIHGALKAGQSVHYPALGKIRVAERHPGTEKARAVYRVALAKTRMPAEPVLEDDEDDA